MSIVLKNLFDSKVVAVVCFSLLMVSFTWQSALGDAYHYKNFLVGDRASLMGGAYAAVSDDAAGAYYNPAGISFAFGDSVSGSGNAFHNVNTNYASAIGGNDWERKSSAILPNFFGLIKKYGDSAFAISYIVPETMIEHQDQVFDTPNSNVDKYYISLQSEDHVYLMGPSYAYKFSEDLSIGFTLYYFFREFRLQQEEWSEYSSSYTANANGIRLRYFSQRVVEKGWTPKIGLQWSPSENLVVGLMGTQTSLFESIYSDDETLLIFFPAASEVGAHSNTDSSEKRKLPTQFTGAVAYYPSPFLLLSADIDYYMQSVDDLQNVLNISLGGELFLDNKNAVRFGIFTNGDSRKAVTDETVANEHIDMQGISFGYSTYSRSSSVTIGMVYQAGSGQSQITGTSTIKDMSRNSLTMVFAAAYSY